jgi:hypothetical protein
MEFASTVADVPQLEPRLFEKESTVIAYGCLSSDPLEISHISRYVYLIYVCKVRSQTEMREGSERRECI